MIAFAMIVLDEVRCRFSNRRLPEQDHPLQTQFLDAAHESLGVCVQIRAARRNPGRGHTGFGEKCRNSAVNNGVCSQNVLLNKLGDVIH